MPYTIKYHGYDVTCDTAEDLRVLVSQNGGKRAKISTPKGGGGGTGIAALVAKLQREQRDLLRFVSNNGVVPRDRLIQMLGAIDARQFAGLLIGISKSAAGCGMESPIEKLTERMDGRGPRVYRYKIRDDVKAEVKEALSK